MVGQQHGRVAQVLGLAELGKLVLDEARLFSELFIVVDAKVMALWGPLLTDLWCGAKFYTLGGESEGGAKVDSTNSESLKNITETLQVVDWLQSNGCRRNSLIVAVGGGVVSDIVGFCAGIYLRGVAWVVVPTTIVGMVDAGIGGKTGVNLAAGKNLLGVVHLPRTTVVWPGFLVTLPQSSWRDGYAELVKHMGLAGTDDWCGYADLFGGIGAGGTAAGSVAAGGVAGAGVSGDFLLGAEGSLVLAQLGVGDCDVGGGNPLLLVGLRFVVAIGVQKLSRLFADQARIKLAVVARDLDDSGFTGGSDDRVAGLGFSVAGVVDGGATGGVATGGVATGGRAWLNWGHTVGHALECLAGWRVGHGHAVAVGLVVEQAYAERLLGISGEVRGYLVDWLGRAGLLAWGWWRYSALEVYRALQVDKKAVGGSVVIIYSESWGFALGGGGGDINKIRGCRYLVVDYDEFCVVWGEVCCEYGEIVS